jgi:hypothetical protein
MKRAEVGLSTTAVVTIIVSLLILALLIAFTRAEFGKASERFSLAVDESLDARDATREEPLAVLAPASVHRGEQFTLKASVYSRSARSDVTLVLTCPEDVLDGALQGSTKDVASSRRVEYVTLGRVHEQSPLGSVVCALDARADGGIAEPFATADVILTVE